MKRIWISLVAVGLLGVAAFVPAVAQTPEETPADMTPTPAEADMTPTPAEEETPAVDMTPTPAEEETPAVDMTPTPEVEMTPTPEEDQVPPVTGGSGTLGTGSALLAIAAASGLLVGAGLLVRRRAQQQP